MIKMEDFREDTVFQAAKAMGMAALTAPKARGTDNLSIAIAGKEELHVLSEKLEELYRETQQEFLHRDAQNILAAQAVLLIGSRVNVLGLDCGYCGFATCAEKQEKQATAPCFFNANDLGIAIGSACSTASDWKVDTRVMFSVGMAARALGMLKDCPIVLAIAMSASGKSIFFDRTVNK